MSLTRSRVVVLLLVGLMAVAVAWRVTAGAASSTSQRSAATAPEGVITVDLDDRTLFRVSTARFRHGSRFDAAALAAEVRRRLPAEMTQRRGRARITYRLGVSVAVRDAARLGAAGGVVGVRRIAVSSEISAPVVAQKLRNNCESAALEVLLATTGRRIDQLALVGRIPRNGPLDPDDHGSQRVWGDPELGFVGRAAGGGVAGGFGVYQRPIASTAARLGRRLTDLTGSPSARLYRQLLGGRAVMAWVGLSDGPYGRWRSPTGRAVTVNFGEHAVVLVGVARGGDLLVVNPLHGTSERWSRVDFELMWKRLGRRALGT